MCLGNSRYPRAMPLANPGYQQLQLKPSLTSSYGKVAPVQPSQAAPFPPPPPQTEHQNQYEQNHQHQLQQHPFLRPEYVPPPACGTRSHDHQQPQATATTMAAKKPSKNKHITVQHDYHDHARDSPSEYRTDLPARGGVTTPFPIKLFRMLAAIDGTTERDGCESEDGQLEEMGGQDFSDIISWQPHGRCFVVHKPKEFTSDVLPKFMGLGKLASFQRQLNLYGFQRLTRGRDRGGYYHELFLRGKFYLAHAIGRSKVKGTGVRGRSNPDQEPAFWSMPWVNATDPNHKHDCDESISDVKPAADPETKTPVKPPARSSIQSIVSRSSSSSVNSDETTAGSSIAADSDASSTAAVSATRKESPRPAPSRPPRDIVISLDAIKEEAPTDADAPMALEPPLVPVAASVPSAPIEEDDGSLSCCLVFDDQDDKAIFQYFLDEDDDDATPADEPKPQPELSASSQAAIQFGRNFFDTNNTDMADYETDAISEDSHGLSLQDWTMAMEQLRHW